MHFHVVYAKKKNNKKLAILAVKDRTNWNKEKREKAKCVFKRKRNVCLLRPQNILPIKKNLSFYGKNRHTKKNGQTKAPTNTHKLLCWTIEHRSRLSRTIMKFNKTKLE